MVYEPKWSGVVYLQSNYKELSEYVTSDKEELQEATQEILNRYKSSGRIVEGIHLKLKSEK